MKQSQFSLSSVAIASLAFLLNWLVFVDSAPLAALTIPFEVESNSQSSALLPIFPQDKTVLDFDTQSYAVQIVKRDSVRYLNLHHKNSGRMIISDGAVQPIWQGGSLIGYRYISTEEGTETGLARVEIRRTSDHNLELSVDQAGQQHTEVDH